MWFCAKRRKIGKGNLYLTENRFGRNAIYFAKDNHNHMSNMCAKELSGLNFDLAVTGQKNRFFKKLTEISHIHKKCILKKFDYIFLTNCFYPTNFMSVACEDNFFIPFFYSYDLFMLVMGVCFISIIPSSLSYLPTNCIAITLYPYFSV